MYYEISVDYIPNPNPLILIQVPILQVNEEKSEAWACGNLSFAQQRFAEALSFLGEARVAAGLVRSMGRSDEVLEIWWFRVVSGFFLLIYPSATTYSL